MRYTDVMQTSQNHPHAIIPVGLPGAGKTTFSQQFAHAFSAPLVSTDDLQQFHIEDTAAFSEWIIPQLVKTKQLLVLDLPSGQRQQRAEYARLLRHAGYRPLFVWIQLDEDTARLRAKKAGKEYEKQARQYSAPHPSEPTVVISGKHTFVSQARTVLKRLSTASPAEEPLSPATPVVQKKTNKRILLQ